MNVNELRQENAAKGWTSIPESCPARFVTAICEKRSRSLTSGIPLTSPEARGYGAFTRVSQHVVKPQRVVPVMCAHGLRQIAYVQGLKIKADAEAVRAENARVSQEVAAMLFPWEVSN
jgi:hypothetical protein